MMATWLNMTSHAFRVERRASPLRDKGSILCEPQICNLPFFWLPLVQRHFSEFSQFREIRSDMHASRPLLRSLDGIIRLRCAGMTGS